MDAPVSGGVIGAENGTLTFMVGGTADEYEIVKSLLECMGQRITHCGGYGMGQAAKLCNNMMLGISMIGVCETMNLAVRLGLDAKVFSDIINSSTGRCWSSEVYNPVPGISTNAPSNKNYDGGFSTALITKVSVSLLQHDYSQDSTGCVNFHKHVERMFNNIFVFIVTDRIWVWRPTLPLLPIHQFHWVLLLTKSIARCNARD